MFFQHSRAMPGIIKTMMAMAVIISLLNSGILIPKTDQNDSGVTCTDPVSDQLDSKDSKTNSYSSTERSGRNVQSFDSGKDTFLFNDFDLYGGHKDMNFGGDPTIYISYDTDDENDDEAI